MDPKEVNPVPPGQSSNPSLWDKRTPLLAAAVAGFLVALYLGLYQLHVFSTVWEPFFGNGTQKVLHSFVSRTLPVPDGLLGAFAYLADVILVSAGDNIRWRSRPRWVIAYAAVVGLMGLVSVSLIILQAFILHAWCTLCLVSALLSFSMLRPVYREFLAAFHFLRKPEVTRTSTRKTAAGR